MKLTAYDAQLIESILLKVRKARRQTDVRLMSFEMLRRLLGKEELNFVNRIRAIDPAHFGFKGQFFGIQNVPRDLVAVPRQTYMRDGKLKKIGKNYLPERVCRAYKAMNAALKKELKVGLRVGSGYRSPAYQFIVFIWNLRQEKFALAKVARKVALPGYSEHGYPKRQAIDFVLAKESSKKGDGKGESDFSQSAEYRWLVKHAGEFHFYESYPRDNTSGVIFEPWHWHYEK